jgi:hypothetical protein
MRCIISVIDTHKKEWSAYLASRYFFDDYLEEEIFEDYIRRKNQDILPQRESIYYVFWDRIKEFQKYYDTNLMDISFINYMIDHNFPLSPYLRWDIIPLALPDNEDEWEMINLIKRVCLRNQKNYCSLTDLPENTTIKACSKINIDGDKIYLKLKKNEHSDNIYKPMEILLEQEEYHPRKECELMAGLWNNNSLRVKLLKLCDLKNEIVGDKITFLTNWPFKNSELFYNTFSFLYRAFFNKKTKEFKFVRNIPTKSGNYFYQDSDGYKINDFTEFTSIYSQFHYVSIYDAQFIQPNVFSSVIIFGDQPLLNVWESYLHRIVGDQCKLIYVPRPFND